MIDLILKVVQKRKRKIKGKKDEIKNKNEKGKELRRGKGKPSKDVAETGKVPYSNPIMAKNTREEMHICESQHTFCLNAYHGSKRKKNYVFLGF